MILEKKLSEKTYINQNFIECFTLHVLSHMYPEACFIFTIGGNSWAAGSNK